MTVFDEIMTAENEAEELLANTKKEVAEQISQAETARKEKLTALTAEFEAEREEKVKAQDKIIEEEIKQIKVEAEAETEAVKKKFQGQKTALLSFLKEQFK